MGTLILMVEDDPDIAMMLSDRLKRMGHEVMTAYDGQAALDAMEKVAPGFLLLDLELPKVNGMEVLKRVRKDWPDLPVLSRCAFACAPANAQAELLAQADYVTHRQGGDGAVRELCDLLLVASGRYVDLLQEAMQ